MDVDRIDPTGLIREAYRIEGLSREECRGIFFDWAVGHRGEGDSAEDIRALLAVYEEAYPGHNMTDVLREGLAGVAKPQGRRGGWRSRR